MNIFPKISIGKHEVTNHPNRSWKWVISSKSGASNPCWSLGRRSAFFSYFGPQSIKNLRKIGQNTDFSLNSESSLGRTKIFLGHMRPVGRRLDAPEIEDGVENSMLYRNPFQVWSIQQTKNSPLSNNDFYSRKAIIFQNQKLEGCSLSLKEWFLPFSKKY